MSEMKAKILLIIIDLLVLSSLFAQSSDSIMNTRKFSKAEVLTSGFIDLLNNGQINASARFIRIHIGEPGKFSLPLSFYSGISSNQFQNQLVTQRTNDILLTHLINPLSGLTNVSIDGISFLDRDSLKLTRKGILYHLGQRILTGIKTGIPADPSTGKPINFLNSFGSVGFYMQTGAWDRYNPRNLGLTWLAIRFISCYSSSRQLKKIFSTIQTNGFYHGYSIAWGVEVNNYVNSRLVYYNYFKKPVLEFNLPIYQFSVSYSAKH